MTKEESAYEAVRVCLCRLSDVVSACDCYLRVRLVQLRRCLGRHLEGWRRRLGARAGTGWLEAGLMEGRLPGIAE